MNKKGVTWDKAFLAGLKGKKIQVYGQNMTFRKFKTLEETIKYLANRPSYFDILLKKEWYIEKTDKQEVEQ